MPSRREVELSQEFIRSVDIIDELNSDDIVGLLSSIDITEEEFTHGLLELPEEEQRAFISCMREYGGLRNELDRELDEWDELDKNDKAIRLSRAYNIFKRLIPHRGGVIAIINSKGGCGKTTIAINLAACLAMQGRQTLLVDMDPQSHCAVGLAVPDDQIERNIYDCLIAKHSGSSIVLKNIVWQIARGFDLAPSGIELAAFEPQLAGKDGRENCLREVLAEQASHYDYVIVDCPPNVGLLTFNSLRAANEVIIPVETGYFALHGLSRQLETLDVMREQSQQEIVCRIVPSMYDVRTKLAREVLSELQKHHKAELSKTVINFNTKLKEAASFGQPITEYDPASKGMADFTALAQEVIGSRRRVNVAQARSQVERCDTQLREISESADRLVAEAQELVGTRLKTQAVQAGTLKEKLDDFYGVRQERDRVVFVALYPKAESVMLAGDFNNWQPERTPLTNTDGKGRWSIELPLSAGTYQYRYVVDDRWQNDPRNEHVGEDISGDLCSEVKVK